MLIRYFLTVTQVIGITLSSHQALVNYLQSNKRPIVQCVAILSTSGQALLLMVVFAWFWLYCSLFITVRPSHRIVTVVYCLICCSSRYGKLFFISEGNVLAVGPSVMQI